MSIGLFFVVFFALLLGAVVWILRSQNVRPLTPQEREHCRQEEEYWVYYNPAGPVQNRINDD